MASSVQITPPFFEVGPKAYLYGAPLVALARRADALSAELRVEIIVTPQCLDIPAVVQAVRHVRVFGQHMDSLRPGRGIGRVLPEALRAAGASGVLLNHVERRLDRDELVATMRRADEVGLATMVCADNVEDAVEIARLGPSVIIVEEPSLIGAGRGGGRAAAAVASANAAIREVDPRIRVLHAAGIGGAQDVYEVIAAGAEGTGSTSAIFEAPDPGAVLEAMIRATRAAWDSIQ